MKNILRFFNIQRILAKHGMHDLIFAQPLFAPFKWLLPWQWFKKPTEPTAKDIRNALIELGPIFVKFGQVLSTRKDILSAELAMELAKLQDKVPPFDGKLAKQIIEQRLGQPVASVFDAFDETPLASASIAQVHTAKLKSGEDVVIKVLRPDIHTTIKRDVRLLKALAKWVHRTIPELRRFKPIEVVEEFEYTLKLELDLQREAANCSQLRRNFEDSDKLYVPKIYWDYCFKDVMISERITGVQISDIETLKKEKVNLKKLAENGVDIFFTQVFRDCFFHADMHPGNIYVDIKDPENPRYLAIDFGIMGTLNPEDQNYLASNFLAFFKRDYRKVAMLHIESGWVPRQTRLEAFESSIRAVSEPLFDKPLGEISFGKSLMQLLQTAREYNMQIQPQLLLFQKTLLSIEGLGKQLYPQLNLWQTAKPFLEKWMKSNLGLKAFRKNLKESVPFWLNKMPTLPEKIYDVVEYHQSQVHQAESKKKTVETFNQLLIICAFVMMIGGIFLLFPKLATFIKPHLILGVSLLVGGAMLWLKQRFN